MTTYNMIRCEKCDYLEENDNGEWVCTFTEDVPSSIEELKDCPIDEMRC